MKKKLFLAALVLVVLSAIGVWFFVFYKPTHFKRDVTDEKAIVVTAPAMVKAFQMDETSANQQYLNKTVQVTGQILEAKTDQQGNQTVTLKSEDGFSNVYCTLKEAVTGLETGKTITVKGICTGFLSDVVLIDAILLK